MPRMRRRRPVLVLLAGVLLSGASAPGPASGASDTVAAARTPAAFVAAVGQALPSILRGATTDAARRDRLMPFLAAVVDMPAVGRFCLGRYWPSAQPADRARYLQLLLRSLADGVATRVDVYAGGRTRVTTLPEQAAPDGTEVPTLVADDNGAPVHVTWLVEGRAPPFHMLDVAAEGLSLRVARRDDFTAFLARHDGNLATFLAALAAHAP